MGKTIAVVLAMLLGVVSCDWGTGQKVTIVNESAYTVSAVYIVKNGDFEGDSRGSVSPHGKKEFSVSGADGHYTVILNFDGTDMYNNDYSGKRYTDTSFFSSDTSITYTVGVLGISRVEN